jgi:uncharacterized protein DUF3606
MRRGRKSPYPTHQFEIDPADEYDVRYWTRKFGVTEAQLRDAIDIVGTNAKKIAEYLIIHHDNPKKP